MRVVWQHSLPGAKDVNADDADVKYEIGLRFTNLADDTIRQLSQVLEQHAERVG